MSMKHAENAAPRTPASGHTPRGPRPPQGRADSVTILPGRDLPPQFHLGRRCEPSWVAAVDQPADPHALSVKPSGALWTAPPTCQSPAGLRTTWSDAYYRQGYAAMRRDRHSGWERLQESLRPERLWPVTPDPASAQILRLNSVADLVAAADRWPTPAGHLSFEAMAADGIDGVYATPGAITPSWLQGASDTAGDWGKPHAQLRAQFYGWEIESVAWLRSENISVGKPVAVDHSVAGDRGVEEALAVDQAAQRRLAATQGRAVPDLGSAAPSSHSFGRPA